MKHHHKLIPRVVVPAVFLALPALAHAAGGSIVTGQGKLPTVEVVGNGVEYTGLKPGTGGGWQADLSIDTWGAARIKSWKVWPVVEGGIGLPELNLSLFAASQSYSVGNRPKSVNKTVGQIFPLSLIEAHAVARCNINRNVLSSQGKSNAEIFGQTHVLQFSDLGFRKEVDLTIGNKNIITEGEVHHYSVSCLAHDATPQVPTAGAIVSPFQVTGASLSVSPGQKVQATCPVELTFNGVIQTSGTVPTTVQYRFEWPTGEKSTVFSTHVANPSAGAPVVHKVEIPLPSAAVPGPQGGGGAAPGGFAQLQPPPPPPGPLPEGVPPQPQGPQLQGATLPANEHKSSVRLVVLSPGNVVSAPASYHIVCEPGVRPGVAGPGGMAVPARPGVARDPDRPVVTGTVPNPDRTPPARRATDESGQVGDPALREDGNGRPDGEARERTPER